LRIDFKKEQPTDDSYYDLFEDYSLIEASFAQQYGIRLRREDDMSWNEFTTLLSGLNGDTPLGRIVSIRSEKDPKTIKNFTKEEKRVYNQWRHKTAKEVSKEEFDAAMKQFEMIFKNIGQSSKRG
jgi:hypothetical protein